MRYRFADQGLVFSTRERGSRVLDDILLRLGDAEAETVLLDLEGVRSISYSFADECIGEVCTRLMGQSHIPVVVNAPGTAARTIERSLVRRGISPADVLSDSLSAA